MNREIQNLVSSSQLIQDGQLFKNELHKTYSSIVSYRIDEQDDASQLFFDVVDLLPDLTARFIIIVKKTYACMSCHNKYEKSDEQLFCQLVNNAATAKNVEQILNEWKEYTFYVEKDCEITACRINNDIGEEILPNNKKHLNITYHKVRQKAQTQPHLLCL